MSRTVYVNGQFVAEENATISIFDRGFNFSDGVYEVTSVVDAKLIDNDIHLQRLKTSLEELGITFPASNSELFHIHNQLIEKNNLTEGLVYLQVTRGVADRAFEWPDVIEPTIVMFTQEINILENPKAKTGLSIVTLPDIRWQRRDIKTVGLLAACMAKMQAKAVGAHDAWLFEEDNRITEGSSNNAYIINKDGTLITREPSNKILRGITRRAILKFAESTGTKIEERGFTVDEAYNAKEAFLTSASTFVLPVIKIDNHTIGDGKPGELTQKLRSLYIEMARNS